MVVIESNAQDREVEDLATAQGRTDGHVVGARHLSVFACSAVFSGLCECQNS